MNIIKKIAVGFVLAAITLAGFSSFAHAQNPLWKLGSNQLSPVMVGWGLTVPALANLTCVGTNSQGVFGSGTCSGGGTTYPWPFGLPGNSTSTAVGFLGGLYSTAASTTIRYASTTAITISGNAYSGGRIGSTFTNLGYINFNNGSELVDNNGVSSFPWANRQFINTSGSVVLDYQTGVSLSALGNGMLKQDGGLVAIATDGTDFWSPASLTNLSQLTNGPGYVTGTGTDGNCARWDTAANTITDAGAPCGSGGGGGGVWPFVTTDTNYGVAVQSTTTPEWFKNGVFASSTSRFVYASTTAITAQSANIGRLDNLASAGFVKTNAIGNLSVDTSTYLTTAVTSVATNNGLTGGTITTTGTVGLNVTGLSTNGLVTWTGSILAATGTTGTLTVPALISTSTASSTFAGGIDAVRLCVTGTTRCVGGPAASSTILSDTNTWTGLQKFGTNQVSFSGTTVTGTTGTGKLVYDNVPTLTTPIVNNIFFEPSGTAAEKFYFYGKGGAGIPVPFFYPNTSNTALALDISPNGTPGNTYGIGPAWMDILSTDVNNANYETLRLSKRDSGPVYITSAQGGSGSYRDMTLQYDYSLSAIAGNVGIATGTPSANYRLSVAGGGQFAGNLIAANMTATGTLTLSSITGTQCLRATNGVVGGTGSDCGAGGSTNFLTNSSANTYLNTGSNLQAPTLEATSTTATSTFAGGLTVEGTGLVYDLSTNRVGIGTATARTPLDLVANAANAGMFSIHNTAANGYSSFDFYNDSAVRIAGVGLGNSGTGAPYNGNLYFGTNFSGNNIVFLPNGTESVRILGSNGFVGIGVTTTPGTLLSIGGVGNFAGTGSTLYSTLTAPRYTATSTTASVFPYASTTAITAASADIARLSNLASAGFVKSSSNGTLSVDTSTYLTLGTLPFTYPFPAGATTSPLTLASTTNAGRFMTGSILATSTATSTIAGPLIVGDPTTTIKPSCIEMYYRTGANSFATSSVYFNTAGVLTSEAGRCNKNGSTGTSTHMIGGGINDVY